MKRNLLIILIIFAVSGIGQKAFAQAAVTVSTSLTGNPWTDSQLIEPAALAAIIKAGADSATVILNIGAVEDIKGAKHIGAVNNAGNMLLLKNKVSALPKNTAIVIYCGCCPFVKCPNIRPAFTELQKLGFTNVKLLNIATNLKTNWISRGYPLAEGK